MSDSEIREDDTCLQSAKPVFLKDEVRRENVQQGHAGDARGRTRPALGSMSEPADGIIGNKVEDMLLRYQRLYFGANGANPRSICAMVADGALALGAKRVLVAEENGWWYVCADVDWLEIPTVSGTSSVNVFDTIWAFPEGGEKAFRWEVFCRVFSRCAFSLSDEGVRRISGQLPSDEDLSVAAAKLGAWRRVIGFVFDRDAAQQALGATRIFPEIVDTSS